MSYYDYAVSQELAKMDPPFYALVMAAMRKADSDNIVRLRNLFPETYAELFARYHAPGGYLPGEVAVQEIDDKAEHPPDADGDEYKLSRSD